MEKIFDPKQFLDQFGIPNTDRGKHARAGWVQIKCPFCTGHEGWHGGFNIQGEYYNCWRCGWRSLPDIIMRLLECNYPAAKTYINKYGNTLLDKRDIDKNQLSRSYPYIDMSFPPDSRQLSVSHRKYLRKRNFDPDKLEQEWKLKGTGNVGDYKFRIIAPIFLNQKMVSFQGRDITDKQFAKYQACERKDEIVHHKHTLYGIDKIRNRVAIVVEGVFDVWKFGPGTVGTFGIEFTNSQVRIMIEKLDKVFIFYDAEDQAQRQADKLGMLIDGLGKDVELLTPDFGDPADLPNKEAKELRKELLNY